MSIIYFNGEFIPQEDAKISITDRGFTFGDGIYEVIPVYNGTAFRLPEHIQRLENSLANIRLKIDYKLTDWQRIFDELLTRNLTEFGKGLSLYLQITRGATAQRDHLLPNKPKPTIIAFCMPYVPNTIEKLAQGIKAITLPDLRWARCSIKSTNLLPNVLQRQEAEDQGAQEAILIKDGFAFECTSSNLFLVKDGVIVTPPKSHHLLGGITRDVILELAAKHNMPYAEQAIPETALTSADEIWISSSTREIRPILALNGKPVGDGTPGPIWWQLIQHYFAFKESLNTPHTA